MKNSPKADEILQEGTVKRGRYPLANLELDYSVEGVGPLPSNPIRGFL